MRQFPCEPREFVAGDSVSWTKSLADFAPADGWTLGYRIIGASTAIATGDITASANTTGGWDVSIAATKSGVPAGVYRIIGWVTKDPDRHTIYDQMVSVLADAAIISPAALQTPNEQILAALDARLLGRATADQESVVVDGTALTRIPIEKLATLRGVYAAKVWRERNPGRSNPSHELRFRNA